ncbi:TnsD family Tn7-like transposition protein [Cupriavidus necator]
MLDGEDVPLYWWDRFESAASIGTRAKGSPPLERRGGRFCLPTVAYGTVTWPIEAVAALGDGFYGDVQQILDGASLVNYCAVAMRTPQREALRTTAITGRGGVRDPAWAPWMLPTTGRKLQCPVCRGEAWWAIGMLADCWPHRAPLVVACWRHGVQLQPCSDNPMARAPRVRNASDEAVKFANNTVRLCEMAANLDATATYLHAQLEGAGFLHANGNYRAKRFRECYARYGGAHAHEPTLRRAIEAPLAGRAVLDWVRSGGDEPVHPVYLVVLLGMLEQEAASPLAAHANPPKPPVMQRAWSAHAAQSVRLLGASTRFKSGDIPQLAKHGCEPTEMAALCRISLDAVYRIIRSHGLRPLIERKRHERLRVGARQALLDARDRNPGQSRNVIRGLEPRAFKWLWKHDRRWLQRQRFAFEPSRGWRRKVLPTAGSERRILSRLRDAANRIRVTRPAERCTGGALCRALAITPYVLRRWSQCSQKIAHEVTRLTGPLPNGRP